MSDLLEIAARVLDAMTPPEGAFDASGVWQHTYGVFDLGANLATSTNVVRNAVGTLAINRTPAAGGGATLEINLRRRTPPGAAERVSGRMKCAAVVLASPTEWEFEWEATGTGQKGSLTRKNPANFAPSSAYTTNWALFDVVQRLPRTPGEPLHFALLDEFDLLKPNQSLTFRKSKEVAVGKRPMTLHAFEQFGEGVLPVMYWTDDHGRLLLVISGLIAYAWEGDPK